MRFRSPLPLQPPASWGPVAAALGVAALGLQTTTASASADRSTPLILRGSPEMLYSVQALRGHRPYMEDTNHVSAGGKRGRGSFWYRSRANVP